jgi:oligogalacturonide lyase
MGRLSRRAVLFGFPALRTVRAAGKGQQFAPQAKRYADPLTEREVWRLTPVSHPHFLPHACQRFTAAKNGFALVAGRRDEETHGFRLELPSGRMTQLTQGPGVAGFSLCLAPDERSFFYLQSGTLKQMGLRTLREREIYRAEEGWRLTGDLGVSVDGRFAAVVETREAVHRLRIVETLKGKSWIVTEDRAPILRPQLRPRRDQVLFAQPDPPRLWLVNLDGKQKQPLRPRQQDEEIGPCCWTADGRSIDYAHYLNRKATVRTYNPDTREETVLGRCTQFWGLMGNADNSAIVGESRSPAGPNIYVLFPLTDREITVCEHASSRTSEEVLPRPAFSPDSQWIYFNSDREGVPAVYRAGVADWVEKT